MRVLWKLPSAAGWTGGLNYFSNLARAQDAAEPTGAAGRSRFGSGPARAA